MIMLERENIDYLKEIIRYITGIFLSELENIQVENIDYIINHKSSKKIQSDIIISVGNRIFDMMLRDFSFS